MDQQRLVRSADGVTEKPFEKGIAMQTSPVLAAQRAAAVIAVAQAQREARKVIAEPAAAATPTQRAGRYI